MELEQGSKGKVETSEDMKMDNYTMITGKSFNYKIDNIKMIGKTILHYKILEKLGEGGMGVVYKAEDIKLNREVAIRFLPKSLTVNFEEQHRFKNEALTAAAPNHQNITTIHSIH